ncbi:MAG: 4-phosphoerythronate dehydrogenase [Gammaproteobacteria bacterium]
MSKIATISLAADADIPWLQTLLPSNIKLTSLNPTQITAQNVKYFDALLVRSVTSVNAELLQGSQIRFVGSPTSGINHLDTHWLSSNNIYWTHAPGCNALAVAEYVISCICYFKNAGYFNQTPCRAGIIGMGHVGTQVHHHLTQLGFQILCHDPWKAQNNLGFNSVSLDDFYDLDLICLHPELTTRQPYPSLHLIDEKFLSRQKPETILLNASRGEIIKPYALNNYGQHLIWCFDVWPNEPNIDLALVQQAAIATPHIAGYSLASKQRGVIKIVQDLLKFFSENATINKSIINNISAYSAFTPIHTTSNWFEIILELYNPHIDTDSFKHQLKQSEHIAQTFHEIRAHYSLRTEFSTTNLSIPHLPYEQQIILKKLGFNIPT